MEFLFVFGILAVLVLTIYIATRVSELNDDRERKIIENLLEEEQKKPKYRVLVNTIDKVEYHTIKIEPRIRKFMDYYIETSLDVAERYVSQSYKEGYFEFGTLSIPVAQVATVIITKV